MKHRMIEHAVPRTGSRAVEILLCLAGCGLLTATPALAQSDPKSPAPAEQSFTGSVDIGYRFVSTVGGNFDAYRSVVNLGEGPKLLGADLTLLSPSRVFFDKITLNGTGWGGDPYNTARFSMNKEKVYDFRINYRNIAYYNFLPSYANPLLAQGILSTQQGFDTHRRFLDFSLDLRPGQHIVPFLAYSRDWGTGTGITDFLPQGNVTNEYPVFNQLRDKTDRYRGGVRLEYSKFHLTLEEGGTTFKDDQYVSNALKNLGNRSTPYLGQTLSLTSLQQAYAVRGDSTFTQASGTWQPFQWLDLYGQFLYSSPNSDVKYSQNDAGVFFRNGTLIPSQIYFIASSSQQPHTAGNVTFEIRPSSRWRIIQTWMTDRLETTSALVSYDLVLTPNATAPTASASDKLNYNYSREQIEVLFDATSRLTLRGGFRAVWGDALVRGGVTSPGATERGELRQNVGLAGFQYRFSQKLNANVSYEGASADKSYFRTSLFNYQKASVKVRYQLTPSLSLNYNGFVLDNQNPTPGVNLSFRDVENGLSAFYNPNDGKRWSVLVDYTRSSIHSNLGYLLPLGLTPLVSDYTDNGHSFLTLIDLGIPKVNGTPRLSFGGSFFKSAGSRPTGFYQPIARFSFGLGKHVRFQSEYRYYGMGESYYLYEGFRDHQFTAGLRLTR